ncbi:MAG: TerB N-terminal domain-containing protein, partial [Bulleidia sp.]
MDDHSYSDVPIPRAPASWQKETVPVQIRNMEALFQPGAYTAEDRKRNFFVQGKFMENYEDHYGWNGFFERAFPVYHDMRVDQLRGYFSWRTDYRHGTIRAACDSFALVYLYELLNQIGVKDAEDGYEKIQQFLETYLLQFQKTVIIQYVRRWMAQYTVYYGLKDHIRECFREELRLDELVSVLLGKKEADDHALSMALRQYAMYEPKGNLWYKKNPEQLEHAEAEIWRMLNDSWQKNHETDLAEELIGTLKSYPEAMFWNAMFYDRQKQDRRFEVNPLRIYECHEGRWTSVALRRKNDSEKALKDVLKSIDQELRRNADAGRVMKQGKLRISQELQQLIHEETIRFLHEEEEKKRPKIEIHIDDLGRIRSEAGITRERLLTEEEIEEEPEASEEISAAGSEQEAE